MRGLVVLLGLLLMVGGGAVAGAQFAPVDLANIAVLDQVPGSREFLKTQTALFAGAGAAAAGLLLVVIAAATGGGKNKHRPVVKPPSMARETIQGLGPRPDPLATRQPAPARQAARAPSPAAPRPDPFFDPPQQPRAEAPSPSVAPAPIAAASPAPAPRAKPQASAAPPAAEGAGSVGPDPRMINRKRVQDLVTINDALKAHFARHGAYPVVSGLAGANERGAAWIPGLEPDFLPQLPRDPLHGPETQYVYASDGANYKLLVQGASLVGSANVEVLGIKIDPTRNPTAQNAAYGFWTAGFAGA